MNPYVYSRRGRGSARPNLAPDGPNIPSLWPLVKSALLTGISPVLAFAVIALASSSVFAGSFGINQTDFDLGSASLIPLHALQGKVLGASITQPIIEDSALEAADPFAALTASPVSFDSTIGRWNYSISFAVSNLSGNSILKIGSYVISSNIVSSDSVQTGAILKPNMVYHVSLWNTDDSGNKQILARIEIKTGKAKDSTKIYNSNLSCQKPQSQASISSQSSAPTFCIKKDDGTEQCVPRPCGMFIPLLPLPTSTPTSTPGFFHNDRK
jgi:hypothetical protein